jgi:hypothetical protein
MSQFTFTSGISSIHHQHKDYGIKKGLENLSIEQIHAIENLCKDLLRYIEREQIEPSYFTLIATVKKANRFGINFTIKRNLIFHFHLKYGRDHFNRPNQILVGYLINIQPTQADSMNVLDKSMIPIHEISSSLMGYWLAIHEQEADWLDLLKIKSSKSFSDLGFINIMKTEYSDKKGSFSSISMLLKVPLSSFQVRGINMVSIFVLMIIFVMCFIFYDGDQLSSYKDNSHATHLNHLHAHSTLSKVHSTGLLQIDLPIPSSSIQSSIKPQKKHIDIKAVKSNLHKSDISKVTRITDDTINQILLQRCSVSAEVLKHWSNQLKSSHPIQSFLQRLHAMRTRIESQKMSLQYLKNSICEPRYLKMKFKPLSTQLYKELWKDYQQMRIVAKCKI